MNFSETFTHRALSGIAKTAENCYTFKRMFGKEFCQMAGEYDKSKYTRKERLLNFWYYHRLYIIIGVLMVLFIVVQVHKLTNQPSVGFQGVFMNVISAEQDDGTQYAEGFGEHLGVDPTQFFMDILMYESFDISETIDEVDYASVQQLSAYIANGDLDTAVTDESAFEFLAYWDCLSDLREVYTPEQLEEFDLYYVDGAIVEYRADTMWGTEEYNIDLPDPRNPDAMEDPIPVGIYLNDLNEGFKEKFAVAGDTAIAGIFVTTGRVGVCKSFIEYITE